MAVTTPSRSSERPPVSHHPSPTDTTLVTGKRRLMLQTKLTRQRAMLLANAHLSRLAEREAEAQPDPLDQATEGLEQELAIRTRIRALEQLHRIEHALRLMQTNEYGRCRRCHQEIPYKRLAVKPDTVYCVPCLTRLEEE
ncbi:MAG: TraR/DksA C4-type zinc finger protein [Nitrospira sp.]|nr:TraR/DksA C4-type zinc finger protein [Nitrospira sp.]MCP9465388.1 TraR/DksA C4-type zinc finger protein [Nitrospira sp.]